jgi:DNA-binding FadR family transcriptional regulator
MSPHQGRTSLLLADTIQADIVASGAPTNSVFGTEAALRVRYGVGLGVLREAVRLLEFRECCRMQRGPGGGLVVTLPTDCLVAQGVAGFLSMRGVTIRDLWNAYAAVGIASLAEMEDGSIPQTSEHSPLAGLPDDSRMPIVPDLAAASGSAVMNILALSLNVLWTQIPASTDAAGSETSSPACEKRCREFVLSAVYGGDIAAGRRRFLSHVAHIETHGYPREALLAPRFAIRQHIIVTQKRAGQIARNYIVEIVRGDLPAGAQLGTHADICRRYRISKSLGQQVIRLLEAAGVVRSKRGRGGGVVVVSPPHGRPAQLLCTFFVSRNVSCAELTDAADKLKAASSVSDDSGNQILRAFQDAVGVYLNSADQWGAPSRIFREKDGASPLRVLA